MEKDIEKIITDTVNKVMSIDIASMDRKTKINTISEWDSFNNLMLISEFEESLKVNFTVSEIDNVLILEDLFNLIKSKV